MPDEEEDEEAVTQFTDDHKEQLQNLVHLTILPAFPEDLNISVGTQPYQEALQYLIDLLTKELEAEAGEG